MGLPGWLATIATIGLCVVLVLTFPGYVTAAFLLLVALAMVSIPGAPPNSPSAS